MKQKIIPIVSVFIGFIAFFLTGQYLQREAAKLEKERQAMYAGAETIDVVAAAVDIPAGTTIKPKDLGKITTFMHVSTVCLVLLGNIMPLPPLLLSGCFYTSFGFVIISGFDYIYRVSRSIEAARLEREASESTANSSL